MAYSTHYFAQAPFFLICSQQPVTYLWKVQSWVFQGLGWVSFHPQWPWWDSACCWPSPMVSHPTSACGSSPWPGTGCRSRWRVAERSRESPSRWLQSHSGFWPSAQFYRELHSQSSEPHKTCCPSLNWQENGRKTSAAKPNTIHNVFLSFLHTSFGFTF